MFKMKIIQMNLLILFLLALGGTNANSQSDWDPSVNFENLKTYGWISKSQQQGNEVKIDNPGFNENIQHAIDTELANKGLKKIDSGTPDIWVSYQSALEGKLTIAKMDAPYVAPPPQPSVDGSDWFSNMRTTETFVTEYKEGTLVIEMIDPITKEPIWRGSASDAVTPSKTSEARNAKIQIAVKKALAKFPPK